MKKKLNFKLLGFILIAFLIFTTNTQGQGRNNHWYFGDNAALDFTTTPPSVLGSSQMQSNEGCTSISDINGELLFYSDGRKVWNRYNELMPNGANLLGSSSSTQSAIAVPHPGSSNIYYLFTVDAMISGGFNGLNYYKIDITLDNGRGDIIIPDNNNLLSESPEKITAIAHGTESAFWVIAHGWAGSDANTFYVYQITSDGLTSTPQTYNIGNSHSPSSGDLSSSRGYLKASQDGSLLACAIGGDNNSIFDLFDFNNLTGEITNHREVGESTNCWDPYGVEFSPDATKMYISTLGTDYYTGKLVQVNLLTMDEVIIDQGNFPLYGALQTSPHGIIYMATGDPLNGAPHLHAITEPNELGEACNFSINHLSLSPKSVRYGLPNTIAAYNNPIDNISSTPVCTDENNTYLLEVNSGNGLSGVDYGCLSVTPNPTWLHFKIENPGNIELELSTDPSIDIDFICWGPFSTPNIVPEQLTSEKIVDCSFSVSSIEYCTLDNSSQNEFYILMLTNFENSPCNLTIAQVTGTGSLDCSITEPCYSSDTDCDGVVDIVDITNIAYLFGTSEGDVLFNENFDLDSDGDIDIVDITLVAYDYGWTDDSKESSSMIQNNNSNVQMYFTENIATDEPNTFETTLDISGIENLGAYEITLNYNENNIDVISIEEGELLEGTNRNLFPIASDFDNGEINYAITSLGNEENGASGDGSILKIKFHNDIENTIPFTMNNAQLLEINSAQIPFTFMANYTGINDFSKKSFSIQPNPVNDILYINYNYEAESDITFKIFDILGNQVLFHQEYKGTKGSNQTSIDMQKLSNGIYFIKMEMDKQIIETRKLIKK